MIEKKVTLALDDSTMSVVIPVNQVDSLWRFVFTLFYENQVWQIPDGAYAMLHGRKPDGNVFAFSGKIADNKVIVEGDVQMTAEVGAVVCELSILTGGKVVGTTNFVLDVEAAPKAPEDVSSETTLPAYGEILDRIAEMGGGSATVDNALSATSENPVQNKVIKAALDAISVAGELVCTLLGDGTLYVDNMTAVEDFEKEAF